MNYESWRISFQSSEQAARAAFESFSSECKKSQHLEDEISKLKGELSTVNSSYQYELHVSKFRGEIIQALSAVLDIAENLIKKLTRDTSEIKEEHDRLKGLEPELPPRPPSDEGLPRYGLRWNGPKEPLSAPLDDGYWTPWHLADVVRQELDRLKNQNKELQKERDELSGRYHLVMHERDELTEENENLIRDNRRVRELAIDARRKLKTAKQELDQLRASFVEAQSLLNEHLIEWEKDSGEWDEFNWVNRVSILLDANRSIIAEHDAESTPRSM